MEIKYKQLGKRIKKKRLELGITQDKFSEKVNLSTPHISHIENGNTKLSLLTLVKIANTLGVSLDTLLCDSIINSKDVFNNELTKEVADCSQQEIQFISQTIQVLKSTLRQKP